MDKKPEEIKSTRTETLLKLGEISILLDSYSDIFSDFDPSPYAERSLSDDFIIQAKKFSKDKSGHKISLRLLMPSAARREEDEKLIIKRLHSHFKEAYHQTKTEVKEANRKGIILILTGTALMITASYLSFMKAEKYFIHFLLVLFEPAGWFLLWMGLDHLVYFSKSSKKELDFYSKMSKVEIKFVPY